MKKIINGKMYNTISIHALREEGDPDGRRPERPRQYFYPRPPRGGRQKPLGDDIIGVSFLSTPSARRATDAASLTIKAQIISIHALREEGDGVASKKPPFGG